MATHLTDMEELLARIVASAAADYMAEALKCYHAGAYRACVVTSYIALFHDLRMKLVPLVPVNSARRSSTPRSNKRSKIKRSTSPCLPTSSHH